ncbi:ragulator complex protein LAMTOR5 [Onthophagus taurus]|uniref:ragulator complex protein LAMTOR5 n=1 Tax=Onthophagus taurus TaxID=166361 RepID=UPI000C202A14|nr:ragulator complex protein LAMTOR5 [Onthophagus taurus]
METRLDRVMEAIISEPNTFGCVFAEGQGLCLGTKGEASNESAGIITAIAEQAAKLEPRNKDPIIVFENNSKKCIIHRQGTITAAYYKNI